MVYGHSAGDPDAVVIQATVRREDATEGLLAALAAWLEAQGYA
jgi:hypothetical protein